MGSEYTDSRASYSIVMTACVNPGIAGSHIARSDPTLRLREYTDAAVYWTQIDDPWCERVILLENSGQDLSGVEAAVGGLVGAKRPFEAHNVGDNRVPAGVHYGYAEMTMLDAAVESVAAWASAGLLVKVTGRLKFPGLSKLMKATPKSVRFMADARNRNPPSKRTSENGLVTTQLMAFTPAFYRANLFGLRLQMTSESNFTSHIETMIYSRLYDQYLTEPKNVRFRFPVSCNPVGFGATHNVRYGHGMDRVKSMMRSFGRAIAPAVWL